MQRGRGLLKKMSVRKKFSRIILNWIILKNKLNTSRKIYKISSPRNT